MPGHEAEEHVEETRGCEGERGRSAATNIIISLIMIMIVIMIMTKVTKVTMMVTKAQHHSAAVRFSLKTK